MKINFLVKKIIHITIWILYFLGGLLQIIDFYPSVFNTLALVLVLLLFLWTIVNIKIKAPFISLFVLLGLIIFISGQILARNIRIIDTILFYRLILLPYLYFLVIINEKDERIIHSVFKTIILLFVIQLVAAVVKLFIIGTSEMYIGTISKFEGSMTTLITMVASSFLIAKYLYTRKSYFLVFLLLFTGFGISGGKRAIFFLLPILIIILFYIYANRVKLNLKIIMNYSLILFFLVLVFVYSIIRLTPTLNRENKIGGSFDLNYATEFAKKYMSEGGKTRLSRYEGLLFFYNYMSDQNYQIILLGEGAGRLVSSEYKNSDAADAIEYNYKIKYGGRMGIVYFIMQIGLLGTLLYIYILLKMLIFAMKNYTGYLHLAFIGIWISFVFDFSFYSSASFMYFSIGGTMFFIFALIYRESKKVRKKTYQYKKY